MTIVPKPNILWGSCKGLLNNSTQTKKMIRLYRNVKKCKDGKEYLLDTESDNKPAEFKSKEEIFALFQEEGHLINSIEDLVNMGVHFETTPE